MVTTGVLWIVFATSRNARVIREGFLAACELSKTMRPAYPQEVAANRVALDELAALTARKAVNPYARRMPLALDARLKPMRFQRGDVRRAYLHKLSGLLQSGFNRTVYLDCDVYVVSPVLVHHLLTRALRVADVAMPLDPGRAAHLAPGDGPDAPPPPWVAPAVGLPPLCSAVLAYRQTAAVQALILGAARRLISQAHRGVRQGDQEMIWFEWTEGSGREGLRVLALPEETYCPLEARQTPLRRWRGTAWRTSWRRGAYPCAAVHGHAYARLAGGE